MAAVYSEAGLVTYPNGAVVPYDPANIAATNAHLATTYPRFGYHGYGYHGLGYHLVGKRSAEAEAEADPGCLLQRCCCSLLCSSSWRFGIWISWWCLWLSLLGLDCMIVNLSTVQIYFRCIHNFGGFRTIYCISVTQSKIK